VAGTRLEIESSSSSDVADFDRAGSEEVLNVPRPQARWEQPLDAPVKESSLFQPWVAATPPPARDQVYHKDGRWYCADKPSPGDRVPAGGSGGIITTTAPIDAHAVVPRAASLLGLHQRVQQLLDSASTIFTQPDTAGKIRICHQLARSQMVETVKVLRKLDQLTEQIVESVQDLTVAVEEYEPALAHNFLERQRQWVIDLRHEMRQVQNSNQILVHNVTELAGTMEMSYEKAKDKCIADLDKAVADSKTESEKQAKLLVKDNVVQAMARKAVARVKPLHVHLANSLVEKLQAASTSAVSLSEDEVLNIMLPRVVLPKDGDHCVYFGSMSQECALALEQTPCPIASLHILLTQIDAQLESSSILWAQIEVVFDTILRKEDYVSQLVDFTKNPRLMKRFQARLRDYEYFWNSMRRMVVANLSPE